MYNSATVLPIHPETVKKQDFLSSKKLWRTENGFIFPGKKTSLVSNIHPRKPDSARVDELRKVWKNIVTNLACFSDICSEAVVFFFFFCISSIKIPRADQPVGCFHGNFTLNPLELAASNVALRYHH